MYNKKTRKSDTESSSLYVHCTYSVASEFACAVVVRTRSCSYSTNELNSTSTVKCTEYSLDRIPSSEVKKKMCVRIYLRDSTVLCVTNPSWVPLGDSSKYCSIVLLQEGTRYRNLIRASSDTMNPLTTTYTHPC